jgi:DDE superfamily endonuclease
LRDAWFLKIGAWRAEQLVFIDESGINARSGERTHGWSQKGRVIPYSVAFGRAENYSVLPALTVDGYIACNVYQGAVNGATFKKFIEDLLPQCSRYPGPRSIIVMDNATIHNVSPHSMVLMQGYQRNHRGSRLQAGKVTALFSRLQSY